MRPYNDILAFLALGAVIVGVLALVAAATGSDTPNVEVVDVVEVVEVSRPPSLLRLERVSAYNAVPRQTSADPSTSSCGPTIPGTVALSQDLFFREDGHKYRCGQRVTILTDRGEVFPNLVVWDTMNPRYSLTADVLWPNNNEDEAYEFGISEGWLVFH